MLLVLLVLVLLSLYVYIYIAVSMDIIPYYSPPNDVIEIYDDGLRTWRFDCPSSVNDD